MLGSLRGEVPIESFTNGKQFCVACLFHAAPRSIGKPSLHPGKADWQAAFAEKDRSADRGNRQKHRLFELDADYVEALWALDQPPTSLDLHAMLRDTLAALDQLPEGSASIYPAVLTPAWPN